MDIYVLILPLLIGWILDKLLGDPIGLPHPVVGFGKLISFCEKRWNCGTHRMLKGGVAAIMLILLVYAGSVLVLHYLFVLNRWLGIILSAVLVFYCLAGTTLINEVRQVFLAADHSLEEGRKQVSRIVGRDTSELTDQEVRTAALETLAENLSDGVIAPLFWYLLLGVPGMLAYKMVNTLDSMIGYRNERYLQFGCVAAHIDDMANYIPARLTAFLMVLCAGRPGLLRFVGKYGNRHASPNSGYPESALAVFLAADHSLEEGRKQVSRIVGRDTSELTDQEVRTAALETLAENLSDGVIAPLFWYLLLGVPGMLAYKMVNTLDSMIGYRNERYLQFGCVAAHIDDMANYIPARLTAFLMVLCAGRPGLLRFVGKYGNRHASPNSGYPESALAGILNCRFGGPHVYFGEIVYKPFIGDKDRFIHTQDMHKAVDINRRAEILMVIVNIVCLYLVG